MDQCKSHCPTMNSHCNLEFLHPGVHHFYDRSTYKFGNEEAIKMSKVIGLSVSVEQVFKAHTLEHNDHHYRSRLRNVLVDIYLLLEIRHRKQLG